MRDESNSLSQLRGWSCPQLKSTSPSKTKGLWEDCWLLKRGEIRKEIKEEAKRRNIDLVLITLSSCPKITSTIGCRRSDLGMIVSTSLLNFASTHLANLSSIWPNLHSYTPPGFSTRFTAFLILNCYSLLLEIAVPVAVIAVAIAGSDSSNPVPPIFLCFYV